MVCAKLLNANLWDMCGNLIKTHGRKTVSVVVEFEAAEFQKLVLSAGPLTDFGCVTFDIGGDGAKLLK